MSKTLDSARMPSLRDKQRATEEARLEAEKKEKEVEKLTIKKVKHVKKKEK